MTDWSWSLVGSPGLYGVSVLSSSVDNVSISPPFSAGTEIGLREVFFNSFLLPVTVIYHGVVVDSLIIANNLTGTAQVSRETNQDNQNHHNT